MKRIWIMLLVLGASCSTFAQKQTIKLTTERAVGEPMTFVASGADAVSVNWGDGETVSYAPGVITGKVAGSNIVVTSTDFLMGFDCSNADATALDVSGATKLVSLQCANNKLTSLSVRNFTMLEELDCSGNELPTFSISGVTTLRALNCSYNNLSMLSVTALPELAVLNCSHNQIANLTLVKSTNLVSLDCSYNQIRSLSFNYCYSLQWLNCSHNQLTSIGLDNNVALASLWCSNNEIETLDLRGPDYINTIVCDSNAIKEMQMPTLSESNKPYLIDCTSNNLTLASFVLPKYVANYLYMPQGIVTLGFTELNVNTANDFAPYLSNAAGATTGASVCFYDAATDEPLAKGLAKDYFQTKTSVRFYKPFKSVYGVITSTVYPGLELKTSPFAVIDPTGIGAVEVDAAEGDAQTTYDLQGRPVANPTRGIYVRNGKKVLIK